MGVGAGPAKTTYANYKYLFNACNVPGTMLMLGAILPTCIVFNSWENEREAQEGGINGNKGPLVPLASYEGWKKISLSEYFAS